jgi:hypothetical protein
MVARTQFELQIIEKYNAKPYDTVLREISENDRKWKCHTCSTILKNEDLIDKKCPVCGEKHLEQMCPLDHNHCSHTIIDRIEYCPVCKKAICPECGDHSVVQISRVTGYLQDVSGWNSAKQQELKDRARYNPIPSIN